MVTCEIDRKYDIDGNEDGPISWFLETVIKSDRSQNQQEVQIEEEIGPSRRLMFTHTRDNWDVSIILLLSFINYGYYNNLKYFLA